MTQPSPSTSSPLFKRTAVVSVGDLLIECGGTTGLDLEFDVKTGVSITKKVVKPIPNTCDLKLYGLSAAHRASLAQARNPIVPMSQNPQPAGGTPRVVPCIISAGYQGQNIQLFSGELRSAQSVTDGPEIVTELQTGDGDQAIQQQRLSVAIPPGSSLAQGLRRVLKEMGVGQGNLARALDLLAGQPLVAQMFSKGAVFKGSASEIMSDICRAAGLQWSIQRGTVQFQQLGQPLGGQAVLMDGDHGMVGSATVDTKGILSFVCLMNPLISPGVKVAMNATTVKGGYQVLSVQTTGGTAINDWYNKVEAQPY